jgi:hypothetical protein
MPGSRTDSWLRAPTLKRLVVDAAKEFAVSVGVETTDDQRFEAAQRARVDAEHVLDDVSTLKMRKTLGPERWDKLLREASASLEAAKIQETRAQTDKRVNRRVWLSDAFDHLPPEEQRGELRTLVRCVMVEAGEGPLADRAPSCPGRASPASPVAGLQRTGRQIPRKWRSNARARIPLGMRDCALSRRVLHQLRRERRRINGQL